MDSNIRLYRKRFIPEEVIFLKDDHILYLDDDLIITSWSTLKPRSDFASGFSLYYRKEGFKISRHSGADGSFTRWYCDIITETSQGNDLVFVDLLIDVILTPDGAVHVVDLDEAAEALEQGLITPDLLSQALRSTDKLLGYIYGGNFSVLTRCLEPYLGQ
ncbi:MAG: DUF402 domain-containing protein [Lachnospiraceae bacterium]|nr:DUF402 domain-containing protein [Lachnospiraceae bacterium]